MRIINALFNFKKATHDNKVMGVERSFVDYAKALKFGDVEVLSVTKKNMTYLDELKRNSSQILELIAFSQSDIFSILRLAFRLFLFRPDVAICHSGRAFIFVRLARLFLFKKFPIIAIDHGSNPEKFLAADYVLTVNSFFSKKLITLGKPTHRALVIPNMITIPNNFQIPQKKPFSTTIRLGSLGRISGEKCFDKVIRAMKLLKEKGIEVSYVIGGVGGLETSLKALAVELAVVENFHILGWVEDKQKFFEEVDIFILPSIYETFGIVLLEAMLYNTPIITTNSWGPDEIITHEIDGLKISKDDQNQMPNLIADAILQLVNNQDKARLMALAAHQKLLSTYESSVVAKKLLKICETAIADWKN